MFYVSVAGIQILVWLNCTMDQAKKMIQLSCLKEVFCSQHLLEFGIHLSPLISSGLWKANVDFFSMCTSNWLNMALPLYIFADLWRWMSSSCLRIDWPWELCKYAFVQHFKFQIMKELTSARKLITFCTLPLSRSEFGALLFYLYICDRTNIFGESKKVDLDSILLFTMNAYAERW